MGRENEAPVQLRLEEEGAEKIQIYIVPSGTMIWPDKTGNGMVQDEFHAEKIQERIKGLTGFRTRNRVVLYYNNRTWSISQGALFGAYPQNLHRRTLHPAKE